MAPKKLKVGDTVIFKLVPTHIAPCCKSGLRVIGGWRKGIITDIFMSGCICINGCMVADNGPIAASSWGGTVIRYVGDK